MPEQTHRKVVGGLVYQRPRLTVQVFAGLGGQSHYMYSVALTDVSPCEVELNRGRFLRYVDQTLEHQSSHEVSNCMISWFEERLEWIADNVQGKWSFDLTMRNALMGNLTWSFSDLPDVLRFKLTF